MFKNNTAILVLLTIFSIINCQSPSIEFSNNNRPGVNWYWPDNDISQKDIEDQLNKIKLKGFGGVHIYTGKININTNNKLIQTFSNDWYEYLNYAIEYANKIDLEVDLSIKPYWPSNKDSIINIYGSEVIKTYTIDSLIPDTTIQASIDSLLHLNDSIISVYAISGSKKEQIDITWLLNKSNYTEYFNKNSGWKIYIISSAYSGPDNNGNINYSNTFTYDFLDSAIQEKYLDSFYKPLINKKLHSFIIDEWKYNLNWSHNFLNEFEKRRNYKLQDYLYLFIEGIEPDIKERVFTDYYETISDLIQNSFIKNTQQWCENSNIKLQYYALNSPANIINTFAQADIPFIKQIGKSEFPIPNIRYINNYNIEKYGKPHPFLYKFASSASNLNNKKYTSACLGSKISDHFSITLLQLKSEADLLFTSGINKIYLDGMPYSPSNISWPGYIYDQISNIGPVLTIWNDIGDFNEYISTCQKILQNSIPDNDILIYFPIYDYWGNTQDINNFPDFSYSTFNDWFIKSETGKIANELHSKGYTFDFISDEQINNLTFNKAIESGNINYKLLVFPRCSNIPLATLNKILELAEAGANIVFAGGLPKDIPGFYKYETKRLKLLDIKYALFVNPNITVAQELSEAYIIKDIQNEEFAAFNIEFIRKVKDKETVYYISNNSNIKIDEYVLLSEKSDQYTFFDPVTNYKGVADKNASGKIRIKISPGQSLFIFCEPNTETPKWIYGDIADKSKIITGKWKVSFPKGIPEISDSFIVDNFYQLNEMLKNEMHYYAGILKYEIKFDFPAEYKTSNYHLIDLGELNSSAELIINNIKIGKSWIPPHNFIMHPKIFRKKENTLIININTSDINYLLHTNKTTPTWSNIYRNKLKGINDKPFSVNNYEMEINGLIHDIKIYPVFK